MITRARLFTYRHLGTRVGFILDWLFEALGVWDPVDALISPSRRTREIVRVFELRPKEFECCGFIADRPREAVEGAYYLHREAIAERHGEPPSVEFDWRAPAFDPSSEVITRAVRLRPEPATLVIDVVLREERFLA